MSMNKDQVRGRIAETKGKIKEEVGKLVGNDKLKVKGKAQAKYGDVKQHLRDTK